MMISPVLFHFFLFLFFWLLGVCVCVGGGGGGGKGVLKGQKENWTIAITPVTHLSEE